MFVYSTCICMYKKPYFSISAVIPIVGLALVVLVFGYMLSIFRMKYQGYPYRSVITPDGCK